MSISLNTQYYHSITMLNCSKTCKFYDPAKNSFIKMKKKLMPDFFCLSIYLIHLRGAHLTNFEMNLRDLLL